MVNKLVGDATIVLQYVEILCTASNSNSFRHRLLKDKLAFN